MELNKTLKCFVAKDYRTNISPKKNRSPRKQRKPLPDKIVNILDSSSDEDNEYPTQQETKKEEGTKRKSNEKQPEQDTNSNTSRQHQRPKRRPDWYGQNLMVPKIEGSEGEAQTNEPQLVEAIQEELEAIPNVEELTQQENDVWVNN